jgi:hypothetical protein
MQRPETTREVQGCTGQNECIYVVADTVWAVWCSTWCFLYAGKVQYKLAELLRMLLQFSVDVSDWLIFLIRSESNQGRVIVSYRIQAHIYRHKDVGTTDSFQAYREVQSRLGFKPQCYFIHCIQHLPILTLSWPAGHVCLTYKGSCQVRWDKSIPLFLHAAIYLEVPLFRWTSQNAFSHETAMYKWYCVQCCYAALHKVSFVYGCFVGKCILTGSTE